MKKRREKSKVKKIEMICERKMTCSVETKKQRKNGSDIEKDERNDRKTLR